MMMTPEISIEPGDVRPNGLKLRRRELCDNRALLEMFNEEQFQHFGAAMERFASIEEMQTWLDSLGVAKFEIVAEFNSYVVGYSFLQLFSDRQSHAGWIFIGVREAFRQRGIGSAMLQTLIDTAEIIAGLQRIQLTVFSDNDVAINLYRKFGFEIEGRHWRFVRRGADYVDAFTMARIPDDAAVAASEDVTIQIIQGMLPIWFSKSAPH